MRVLHQWIAAVVAAAISVSSDSRGAEAPILPFTLSWTQGQCQQCVTAKSLVDVEFVGPKQAWAIGYLPPGETGAGDFSILHTLDGARNWTELAHSYQHNDAPLVSFANDREGWMSRIDMPTGDERFTQTRDGGRHWQRFPMRDPNVGAIQNLGDGSGLATEDRVYETHGVLIATADYGRHWGRTPLPNGFRPERMAFSNMNHGVLAGCRNKQLVAISTADGGRHWGESLIGSPIADSTTSDSHCDFQADDLGFVGANHVWLLANKHSFNNGDAEGGALALKSVDGGVHWSTSYQAKFNGFSSKLTSVSFIDDRLGFLTEVGESDATDNSQSSRNVLLYTTDGGMTWQKTDLPDAVWGCHVFVHELRCAAGREGHFEVLRIVPK